VRAGQIPARFAGVWPGKGGGRVYGSRALGFASWTGARRLRRAAHRRPAALAAVAAQSDGLPAERGNGR
jgi:hypothetical protein